MSFLSKLQTLHTLSGELLAAYQTEFPPPPVPEPPAEPPVTRVTTAIGLMNMLPGGGAIAVAPGSYVGNFKIVKAGTSLVEEQPGTVEFIPADRFEPTLEVWASDVTVRGFTIRNGAPDRSTVLVGSPTETDPLKQPNHVLFEGTKVIAGEQGGRRGFYVHSQALTLRNCEARNFWYSGADSQGLCVINGPGPVTVDGGYYEASGENIMFGGGSLPCGVNPTGTVKNAKLVKPLAWKSQRYTVKNLFEVKSGVGIVLEHCELDGCWGGQGQDGSPIVLTPRNQNNDSPWTRVDNIAIRHNRVRNCPDGYAAKILGSDDISASQPMLRCDFFGNLFEDSPRGLLVANAEELALSVSANTFPAVRFHFLAFTGPAIAAMAYVGNVTKAGAYGIWSDDNMIVGLPALQASVQSLAMSGNVIEHHPERTLKYPEGNRLLKPGELAPLLDAEFRMKDGSAGW